MTRPGGALLVNIRDYDEALVARPVSRPPSVSGEIGHRVAGIALDYALVGAIEKDPDGGRR